MSHGRRVWGIGTARTLRAHWTLHELDLPYETRELITRTDSMNSPEFLAHTRRGKIPFLEDGDVAIGESSAIVLHLADRYRERLELAPPPGSRERSEFHDAFLFVLTELDAALYVIRRHEGLADIYGASPVACDAARGYFLRGLGEIERRLADGRPHLLGERFGAADLVLHTCLGWAAFVGIELPRGLAAYRDRIAARPGLARAMAVNFTPAALAALTGAGVGASESTSKMAETLRRLTPPSGEA